MSKPTKNSKTTRVQILNPAGGCGHTSLQHARRFVKTGRAQWEGAAIRMLYAVPHAGAGGRPSYDIRLLFHPITDSGLNTPFVRWPMPDDRRRHAGRVIQSL